MSGKISLDWDKVRAIRASDKTDSQLAREHGVTRTTVRWVRMNATWKDPDYVPRASPRSPRRIREGAETMGENSSGNSPEIAPESAGQ